MKSDIFLLAVCITITLVSVVFSDETYSINKKGNALYKSKQYQESLKHYDDASLLSPSDSRLKMNKGSAHYQLGEFDKAEEAYSQAFSTKDKKQIADAHYNMGNIRFRQGVQLHQSGQQQAQEQFKAALNHYIQALDIRPNDTDAKWNLQLTHQVLKQLQDQDKQDKQDKDKQDNKDQKDKDKDSQQNQDGQNQQDKEEQKEKQDNKQSEQEKQQESRQEEQKQEEQQKQQQEEIKEQDKQDIKKDEAKRIIEMYADDADTLNKPIIKKIGKPQQPKQDW